MLKKLLYPSLLLLTLAVYAQKMESIDRKVRAYPEFASLRDVGIRIQNDFKNDSLRIRAAFIWVTTNISYATYDGLIKSKFHLISYSNEEEKQEAIQRIVSRKIEAAFRIKQGLCIDYALMLNALLEQFGLPSKVITGIAKTEIKKLDSLPTYRNHSWNAVQLNGKWKLMDPTWAAGYVDSDNGRYVHAYDEHYYFTDPTDFSRHHLPTREEWQLLEHPIDAATFFNAPIFLPEYCEKGIRLSDRTSGILTLSEERENYIYFDKLPKEHLMHYTIDGSGEFRRMGFKKDTLNGYTSKIHLRRRFNRPYESLTVYMNNEPILHFKIQDPLNQ